MPVVRLAGVPAGPRSKARAPSGRGTPAFRIYNPAMEPTLTTDEHRSADDTDTDDLVEEELLVEEISIDGMCGVY